MVRTKLSLEEEVRNLQFRACETQQKIVAGVVRKALLVHPLCANDLVNKLLTTGIVEVSPFGVHSVKDAVSCIEAQKSVEALAFEKRKRHKNIVGEAIVETVDEQLPTKYRAIEGLSMGLLMLKVLSRIEDTSLSIVKLKKINVRGHAEENHQLALRILEFATGRPPRLQEEFVSNNVSRGRRTRDLTVPPKFAYGDDCIYSKDVMGTSVVITNKFAHDAFDVDAALLFYTNSCVADIVITQNWSESHASISSKTDAAAPKSDVLLSEYCKDHVVAARRLAKPEKRVARANKKKLARKASDASASSMVASPKRVRVGTGAAASSESSAPLATIVTRRDTQQPPPPPPQAELLDVES